MVQSQEALRATTHPGLSDAEKLPTLQSALSGICIEPDGFGQTGLAFIEGPELLGFQLQRASNVQRIQGADAEGGSVAAS